MCDNVLTIKQNLIIQSYKKQHKISTKKHKAHWLVLTPRNKYCHWDTELDFDRESVIFQIKHSPCILRFATLKHLFSIPFSSLTKKNLLCQIIQRFKTSTLPSSIHYHLLYNYNHICYLPPFTEVTVFDISIFSWKKSLLCLDTMKCLDCCHCVKNRTTTPFNQTDPWLVWAHRGGESHMEDKKAMDMKKGIHSGLLSHGPSTPGRCRGDRLILLFL